MSLPTLYTVAEVAAFMKVTQGAIRKMEERGQLRALRIGKRKLRFREADLLEVIARASSATGSRDV